MRHIECLFEALDEEDLELLHGMMTVLGIHDYYTAIEVFNTSNREGNLEVILAKLLRESERI